MQVELQLVCEPIAGTVPVRSALMLRGLKTSLTVVRFCRQYASLPTGAGWENKRSLLQSSPQVARGILCENQAFGPFSARAVYARSIS